MTENDSLLSALMTLSKHYGQSANPYKLTSGLPLVNGQLTPELLPVAAERAGLKADLRERSLKEINTAALPAILILNDSSACILNTLNQQRATITTPNNNEPESHISLDILSEKYTGRIIYLKPDLVQEGLSSKPKTSQNHWLLSPVRQAMPIYSEVLLASLCINLFALGTPLFVMNVYDRVLANHAFETLWVLASGMALLNTFDFIMKLLRSWFLDQAGHRIDLQLSSTVFGSILNQQHRPQQIGSTANHLQEFEGFRQFLTSTTITTLIDLPFIFLFLGLIAWIAGPLAWLPVAVIPLSIGVSYILQRSLKTHVDLMMQEGYVRDKTSARLIE